jgi:outer membrane autotransporter protein
VDSLDDQTLGRIELGGRYALDGKMSLYGYVNYTTGSDYDDIAAGLGFNYRWY